MRVWLLLIIVVLSAGCSGLNIGSADQPNATPTPTGVGENIETPTEGPDDNSPEESTPTSDPAAQNPWNKETVSIHLRTLGSTANETRQREAFAAAIEWFNAAQPGDYPVHFEVVEAGSADVTVEAQDTIEQCGDSIATGTYYWCSPSISETANPDGTDQIQVSTRYEQNATEQFYREALTYFVGVQEPDTRNDINPPDDPAVVDPWPTKSTVHVSIQNAENWSLAKSQVKNSIEYWESGAGSKYRNYTQRMVLVANDTDADVTVRYKESIGICGFTYTGEAGGCAPVYSGDSLASDDSTIEISTQYTPDSQQSTLKHEFGHVYGRLHGQEPMPLMAAQRNLTLKPRPNATDRPNPWEYDTVTVYIDRQSIRERDRETVESEFEAAIEYLQTGGDGNVPGNVTFDRVADKDDADIVFESTDLDGYRSDGYVFGQDTDSDSELEYYTSQTIQIDEKTPADHYAYHIAYWMLSTFVGDGDMPDHLDAEDDNREQWENNR